MSERIEKTVLVQNEHGLHARPAAEFVKLAASFPFSIKIEKDGKVAEAKSILAVMSLSVQKGESVKISAEHEDAENALTQLEKILES